MGGARKEKHNKALEHLNTRVAETLNSETWKAALNFRRKLQHPYSMTNLLLIHSQRPDATMVAGFNKWKQAGRQVKKGEKGIMILAPLTRKRENDQGEEERFVSGFRTAYVFDVSQTEGKEIPITPPPTILSGEDDAANAAKELFRAYINKRGWKLREEAFTNGALGSWQPDTRTITIDPGLPALQYAKTVAHEIAHGAAEHSTQDDRATAELEAETTAYLVMLTLGLDTGDYTFSYLSHWAGSAEAMEAVLEAGRRATKLADAILDELTTLKDAELTAA